MEVYHRAVPFCAMGQKLEKKDFVLMSAYQSRVSSSKETAKFIVE